MYTFHDKKSSQGTLNHVLTIVYNVEIKPTETHVVFSGVSWNRTNASDQWTRSNAVNWARTRLESAPITLIFVVPAHTPTYYQYRRLENYLKHYIYTHGLKPNTTFTEDDFVFDQTLTPKEVEQEAEYNDQFEELNWWDNWRGIPLGMVATWILGN